jgi:hypothetical protein
MAELRDGDNGTNLNSSRKDSPQFTRWATYFLYNIAMSQNISRTGTDSAVTTKKPLTPRLQVIRNLRGRSQEIASQAKMEEEFLAAERLQRALDEENPRPDEKPRRLRLPLRDLFFSPISRAGEILIDLHLLNESRKG